MYLSPTPLSVLFKPHHNVLTGNYDINVLIAALEEKGKTVVWHDRRKGASSIDVDAPEDVLMGVVINVALKRFAGIWRSRHWIALRKIDGVWLRGSEAEDENLTIVDVYHIFPEDGFGGFRVSV